MDFRLYCHVCTEKSGQTLRCRASPQVVAALRNYDHVCALVLLVVEICLTFTKPLLAGSLIRILERMLAAVAAPL